MNTIRFLPSQIPTYWELIKYITVKVDEVDDRDLQPYLNELLHALLNGKAQCFVRLDENRSVVGVCITRFMADKITGKKYLLIQNAYAFESANDETRKQDFDFIKEFAKKEQCSYLSFSSRNKRIWALGEMNNFKEKFRTFEFRL